MKRVVFLILFIWPAVVLSRSIEDLNFLVLEPALWTAVGVYLVYLLLKKYRPKSKDAHPDSWKPVWQNGLGSLLALTLAYQLLAVLTILSFRKIFRPVTDISSFVTEHVSPLVPAVSRIPKTMVEAGFDARIQVTQDVTTLGYLYAFAMALWLWRNPSKVFAPPKYRRRIAVVLRPFIVLAGLLCIAVFWWDAGVSTKPTSRPFFEEFEASDVALFYRMWLFPSMFLLFGSLVVGLGFLRNPPKDHDVADPKK